MITLATKGYFGNSLDTKGKFLSAALLGKLAEIFIFLSRVTTAVTLESILLMLMLSESVIEKEVTETSIINNEAIEASNVETEILLESRVALSVEKVTTTELERE